MYKPMLILSLLIAGCTGIPENIVPVQGFKLNSYLGKWYEIARLDHSFERGLTQVTAEYSMRNEGGVRVINRGYNLEKNEWKEAEGKAYFVEEPDKGYLKVSFFGPFYGSYIVMDVDYSAYTFISGPDTSYLWILARTPTLPKPVVERLVEKAAGLGFDVKQLMYPDQL
ncbi:MAG: lipocalin family protein [Ghiorsea sp.]